MDEQNQRGFFGIIITKEILEDGDLSVAEKFIYGYIASFQRCCFESNEKIAQKLGLSESAVAHTIPKLAGKGYLFVEKSGKSTTRRIYSVYDNPKKLKYLAKKGMFNDENEVVENSQNRVQNMHSSMQNMHSRVQNMHSQITGVVSAKYADIEKEQKRIKSETEQKPNESSAGLAGNLPASRLDLKRKDFETEDEYERAFYQRNTICLGAH